MYRADEPVTKNASPFVSLKNCEVLIQVKLSLIFGTLQNEIVLHFSLCLCNTDMLHCDMNKISHTLSANKYYRQVLTNSLGQTM